MIVRCFDCNIHWISQMFDRGNDISYIYVDGNQAGDDKYRVIAPPF